MLADDKLKAALRDFECVEWRYDGLGGSVIRWTKEHGNTHDDPIELIWVVDANEKEIGKASHGELSSAAGLTKWVTRMKGEFLAKSGRKAKGPRKMLVQWNDARIEDGKLDGWKATDRPVLGYVFIPAERKKDKKWKPYAIKSEKLESGALADKELAKLAEKCFTVRFDYTDEKVRAFLKETWGIKNYPLLFLLEGKKEKPRLWRSPGTRASEVIKELKKLF